MTDELPQDRKIPSDPNEALPLADRLTRQTKARVHDDHDRHHGSRDGTLFPRAPGGALIYAQGHVIKGRWELLDQLGQGSGGRVFRASDQQRREVMEVHHALKLISSPAADLDRVRKEISVGLAAHQNLVRTIDFGYTDDARTCFFIVMDLVAGGTLADLIRNENGRVDGNRARRLCHGILHGLDALHRRNLVHRDLKPTNILIDVADGTAERPLLSDFGISHTAEGGQTNLQGAGTFGYAAPEQLKGRATYASDIYAFGRIVFELLVGRLPDYGDPPLELLRPELPATVGKLVVACMANDPAKRPQSARELIASFDDSWPMVVDMGTAVGLKQPNQITPHLRSVFDYPNFPGMLVRARSVARSAAKWVSNWQSRITERVRSAISGMRLQLQKFQAVVILWNAIFARVNKWVSDQRSIDSYRARAEAGNAFAMFNLGWMYANGKEVEQSDREAVRWYRAAAFAGNSGAMCNLGVMYANGIGVAQNDVEAVRLYRASAVAGNVNAMFNLAGMYASGRSIDPSDAQKSNLCYQANAEALWYHSGAEAGDPRAMFKLGLMYEKGIGVASDYVVAVRWYRAGADAAYGDAMGRLGWMYARGTGVPQDYVEAVRWYRASADMGSADAMFNLSTMYINGTGVQQDDVEALRFCRCSAEAGHADAMCRLGWMHATGKGVEQSDVQATLWYHKSADAGNADAMHNLGVRYANGTGVVKSDAESARWYRMSADAGNVSAMFSLGVMYEKGMGVEQNDILAVSWYQKSAAQGNAMAMYNLSMMYANGLGVRRSNSAALNLCRKSAEAGHARAMFCLGRIYDKGTGVSQDFTEAVRWYRSSADVGDAMAMCSLGVMYANGTGVDQNDVEAVRWSRSGAEAGDAHAMFNLGLMYANGRGVDQSLVEAVRWCQASAALGHAEARQWLKSKGSSEVEE